MISSKEMRELGENASALLAYWKKKYPEQFVDGYELWTGLEDGEFRFEIISDAFTMSTSFVATISADDLKTPSDLYDIVKAEIDKHV